MNLRDKIKNIGNKNIRTQKVIVESKQNEQTDETEIEQNQQNNLAKSVIYDEPNPQPTTPPRPTEQEAEQVRENWRGLVVDLLDHYTEYDNNEIIVLKELYSRLLEVNLVLKKYDETERDIPEVNHVTLWDRFLSIFGRRPQ